MSTPQSGPPDPYSSGPVSGAPQPQYDPYSNPPPPQTPPPSGPGAPPPPGGPFGPGGSAPATKPPVLALGGAGCGFIGLMFLVTGVMRFLDIETDNGSGLMVVTGLYAGLTILMALGSFLGAVLCFAGSDFGRAFAAAVGGAAIWSGANVLVTIIGSLVASGSIHFNGTWVSMITGLLGGAAGIAVVIMMAAPALSKYFAAKSDKPAGGPGVPPNGPGVPPPGGSGMAPPLGGSGVPPHVSGPGAVPPPVGPGAPPPAGPQY